MTSDDRWLIDITPQASELFSAGGFDVRQVFSDPRITVWRDLPERQNCVLDLSLPSASSARLHIKRYKPGHALDVQHEVAAIGLLRLAEIDTVPLLAWGAHADGWAFLITSDLSGHIPADEAIKASGAFDRFAPAVAQMAARLHRAGLHHQDLYLCHFFVRREPGEPDVHLLDPGRVKRMRLRRLRWITKDLAQLIYSMRECELSRAQQQEMLRHYFHANPTWLSPLVRLLLPLKVAMIARHDRKLRKKKPGRRVSLRPAGV